MYMFLKQKIQKKKKTTESKHFVELLTVKPSHTGTSSHTSGAGSAF